MAKKASYGRGYPKFLEYVKFIVVHPAYRGMPDVYLDNGEVQWEAPSNRTGGKFKDTHHKRRNWWRRKAREVGIDPTAGRDWISQVAKLVHPTKKKPCKSCGRILNIRYVYPSRHLLARVRRLPYIDESFPLDPLEHVADLITRLVEQFGDFVFKDLPNLLRAKGIKVPNLPSNPGAWSRWIEKEYIPLEPAMLSPGAMSNAPDRLDGFHSFNRCCREKVDPGRTRENLQSYATDRRVFEYWVDGNWITANRLMGLIRSDAKLKDVPCINGHPGPCSADHIGPISLGFVHRPEFRLLCRACNSTKNNRMSHDDVVRLREAETAGEVVASWYCRALWNLRKNDVGDGETALRLSKLLRDNRHTVMAILDLIAREKHLTFLATYLGLPYAEQEISFEGLRVGARNVTRFDSMAWTVRTTKYATEQKARRLRVAFSTFKDYATKGTRNAYVITTPEIDRSIARVLQNLTRSPNWVRELDRELASVLRKENPPEERLRSLVGRIPTVGNGPVNFREAQKELNGVMELVAKKLSSMWTDDRYVRAETVDDDLSLDTAE